MNRQSKLIVLREEVEPPKNKWIRPRKILHCTHINKGKKYPYWKAPSLLSQLVGR